MRYLLTSLLVLSMLLFVACGGDDETEAAATEAPATPTAAPAEPTATPEVTIDEEASATDAITETETIDEGDAITATETMTDTESMTVTTATDSLIETSTITETPAMTATGIMTAPMAQTTLYDSGGNPVGDATFTETDEGVIIQATLREFTAAVEGEHGIHIHAVGTCEPDFAAAGGHFNPTSAMHGMENSDGPHAGDLPNMEVDGSGNAIYQATNTMITLGDGEGSLFDNDGSALVIHAGPDDMQTDPSGESGDRIACGVIELH